MKTLNAKRIAAVVAGAALLGVGLAFAGPITFQNIPIISNSGQPVVQIVIGSQAKPSDGVVAANIAAAIGNLAYTSVPVTATVNQTQANKVLKVSVSSPTYALSNQQVWLNESGGVASTASSYVFGALIGSVLNGAVILNSPQYSKFLQGSSQYSFQETTSLTASPTASPYTAAGQVPFQTSVTGSTNGGGVSFSSGFSSTTYDNLMQITSAQLPTLLSNFGGSGETTYLWITGFPVFNQGSAGSQVNQFQLLDAGGAYQAVFNNPIQDSGPSNAKQINAQIRLLGNNYTIINATPPGNTVAGGLGSTVTSTTTIQGGSLFLASALAPLQTIYVGHNITSTPWTVTLQDLGQPNSNGISTASVAVYYNGALTNQSSLTPGTTTKFNVTGHTVYVNVNATFAGLYAYQKWAKLQLYTNVYPIVSGKAYNQTTNPGWIASLLWTNTTSSSAPAKALQSIILYNATPVTLNIGQSLVFIQSPQKYKVTFVGETLGAGNFDPVTVQSSNVGPFAYTNLGTMVSAAKLAITNVTEPAEELTVTSQIPSAFSYVGQTASSVVYDLTPFELSETGNAMQDGVGISGRSFSVANSYLAQVVPPTLSSAGTYNTIPPYNDMAVNTLVVSLSGTTSWISATNPLTVTVSGNAIKAYGTGGSGGVETANLLQTQTFSFTSTATQTCTICGNYYNISAIGLVGNEPLGTSIIVTALETFNSISGGTRTANSIEAIATGTSLGTSSDIGYANTALESGLGTANFITLDYEGANSVGAGQWVTTTQPLTALVTGYTVASYAATTYAATPSSSPTTVSVTFTSNSASQAGGSTAANSMLEATSLLGFYNITGIQLSRALPGALTINAYAWNPQNVTSYSAGANANSVLLAQLTAVGQSSTGAASVDQPVLTYTQAGKSYSGAAYLSGNSVIYNQQNGQPTNTLTMTATTLSATSNVAGTAVGQYYNLKIGEVAVPTNTAATDAISIGIDNNSAGIVGQPTFQLNYSVMTSTKANSGTKNNVTYTPSSQGTAISVPQGFRTERGSKLVSITPSVVTLNLAKAVDTLQFTVGNANTSVGSAKSYNLYGPYTVGQATNIANTSIGPVNASIKLGAGTTYGVSGIRNLTGTPSVAAAYQPVWLKNLTTTPLVVLDTQASPGSNLILIGSGYVNALSQQVQNSYNVSITPSTANPVVQAEGNNKILVAGYTAAQTVQAGNSFIQQLYAQAH